MKIGVSQFAVKGDIRGDFEYREKAIYTAAQRLCAPFVFSGMAH